MSVQQQGYFVSTATRAAMKTADENDTGSTFIDDADMRLTVKANTRYTAILNFIVTSGAAGATSGLKYNMTIPSGATELFALVTADNFNAGASSVRGQADFDVSNSNLGNNSTAFIMNYYSFKTSTTSGTAIVQWAQAVADASLTTMKEGSSLTLIEV